MSDFDWFAVLWVGGAIAYLTVLVQEKRTGDRDAEEAAGGGNAGTHYEPVAHGRAAGVFTTED